MEGTSRSISWDFNSSYTDAKKYEEYREHIFIHKYSLGRPRCKWEDNIKIDFREIGRELWARSVGIRIRTDGVLL
jgi:hypothetical protein